MTWNQINDANPSQILGNLDANGYVVLQNQNGFYIGGQAVINAHGLVMTTAATPAINLSCAGPWSFNAPPPTAKIINYGQIKITGGGSAFLIASDIENANDGTYSGTINAPGGNIGLYAGQTVLVSASPDGRGLSAQVTLPTGSVDNQGNLIADAGSIVAQAQVVNQNGLIQANSAQNVNGTIELVAGDTLNLNAGSALSANGSSLATSAGGLSLQAGTTINNNGQAVADGSSILMQAPVVNQNGILRADSLGKINGVVEIDASASLNLGAGSAILATGDSTASSPSPGGFVVLNAGNNAFTDTSGSTISVSGAAGGQNGIIEIFGNGVTAGSIQSGIGSYYAYLINPDDLYLSTSATTPTTTTDASHPNPYANLKLSGLAAYAQIDLFAPNNIELDSVWTLADPGAVAGLSLTAGNNITLNTSINAGNNWNVNLTAGTQLAAGSIPTSGTDGIYLNNGAYLQTKNGDINLDAANEVIVSGGAIRTMNGGNIAVTATYGDVNTGTDPNGYIFSSSRTTPYTVSSSLGGISTAAGGNISITAGGDVISYSPSVNDLANAVKDGGSGAFGSQPGNVNIVAGGNVYGNYVVANGTGSIMALNGNIGDPNSKVSQQDIFALSLISGSWTVNAPNGSISLQEVRNPNGVFNTSARSTANIFNYAPDASVTLNAGNAVEIWGNDQPGVADSVPRNSNYPVPVVLPPILNVTAGAGGFTIDHNLTIYQSRDADLNISTTDGGNFVGVIQSDGSYPSLYMSDSASSQWSVGNTLTVGNTLVAATPYALGNPNYGPAIINVQGSLEDVNIYTVKETQIMVGGDMINSSFAGQNLHSTDVTSITVAGQVFYTPLYSFESLGGPLQPNIPSTDIPLGSPYLSSPLNEFFGLLVNKSVADSLTVSQGTTYAALNNYTLYPNLFLYRNSDGSISSTAGLGYNVLTHTLSFRGPMDPSEENYLASGPFYVVQLNANGYPVLDNSGHLVLDPVSLAPASVFQTLYNSSLSTTTTTAYGLQIGGPGLFNITAGSINLGDSFGIESWGITGPQNSPEGTDAYYTPLVAVTPPGEGAAIKVTTLNGDSVDPATGELIPSLDMLSSRIASWYGGDVTVVSGGSMNLGTQEVVPSAGTFAYGIFTIDMNIGPTGHGNVTVEAQGDININGSRIAAFNGGNVTVTSDGGDVNVGSGGNSFADVDMIYVDPITGLLGPYTTYAIFGSGIVAESLPSALLANGQPSSYNPKTGATPQPGNIKVTAYHDITASVAGILQIALGGSTAGGPAITLDAGNDIDLGNSGVIGGTVTATAENVSGLIISRQNSTINAAANFSGVVLAGGTANLNAASGQEVVIGIGGINSSLGSSSSLTLLSQNLSVGN